MSNTVLAGYENAEPGMINRFEAISSEKLYRPVEEVLPKQPATVLDIGAGTGRDAAWFASKGATVVAVEPVDQLRETGRSIHRRSNIEWINDALPLLTKTLARKTRSELIVLSGVWQHLDRAMRECAMPNLRKLTQLSGTLIISVRHGPGAPSRPVFPADVEHTISLARREKFALRFQTMAPSIQNANRDAGVTWTWLVFTAR